jgi:heparan-alpha-glucosaminide N-acetyltransferase
VFQVDVHGFRTPTIPMEWMGKHALMIYVLVACNILPMFIRGFYWRDPKNNLVSYYIYDDILLLLS